MNQLWYNNFNVILENPMDIFPSNNLTSSQKINSLARLAFILIIFIIISKVNQQYFAFPILLLIISFCIGKSESFTDLEGTSSCYRPTESNPYMNFTFEDYIKNPERPENCSLDCVRDDQLNEFRKRVLPDQNDLWGQNISDRNFYTNPSTAIVNDQTGFANFLFSSMGECKAFNKGCLDIAESRTGIGMFKSVN